MAVSRFKRPYCFVVVMTVWPLVAKVIWDTSGEFSRYSQVAVCVPSKTVRRQGAG